MLLPRVSLKSWKYYYFHAKMQSWRRFIWSVSFISVLRAQSDQDQIWYWFQTLDLELMRFAKHFTF